MLKFEIIIEGDIGELTLKNKYKNRRIENLVFFEVGYKLLFEFLLSFSTKVLRALCSYNVNCDQFYVYQGINKFISKRIYFNPAFLPTRKVSCVLLLLILNWCRSSMECVLTRSQGRGCF